MNLMMMIMMIMMMITTTTTTINTYFLLFLRRLLVAYIAVTCDTLVMSVVCLFYLVFKICLSCSTFFS